MKRLQSLDLFQKGILLLVAAMSLVFSVLYPVTMSRKGFLFQDAILVPHQENGDTLYSGKLHGEEAVFTVSADGTIRFTYGETMYGPYSLREDPTAVPEDQDLPDRLTGIEIRCGEEPVFRGGYMLVNDGEDCWLFGEDNSFFDGGIFYTGSGPIYNAQGQEIDPMEPSPAVLLSLFRGPDLTRKGEVQGWLLGVSLCVLTALTILFADELFRWNLSFRVREPDRAEPSEWELGCRYLEWVLLPILALTAFWMGLR